MGKNLSSHHQAIWEIRLLYARALFAAGILQFKINAFVCI